MSVLTGVPDSSAPSIGRVISNVRLMSTCDPGSNCSTKTARLCPEPVADAQRIASAPNLAATAAVSLQRVRSSSSRSADVSPANPTTLAWVNLTGQRVRDVLVEPTLY